MVYGRQFIKMDDLGVPLFSETSIWYFTPPGTLHSYHPSCIRNSRSVGICIQKYTTLNGGPVMIVNTFHKIYQSLSDDQVGLITLGSKNTKQDRNGRYSVATAKGFCCFIVPWVEECTKLSFLKAKLIFQVIFQWMVLQKPTQWFVFHHLDLILKEKFQQILAIIIQSNVYIRRNFLACWVHPESPTSGKKKLYPGRVNGCQSINHP